jgi:hypothetical protein
MKKLWELLGSSSAWVIMFVCIVLFELISGATIKGMFYAFIFMLGYFLCRIAEAIENMSKLM